MSKLILYHGSSDIIRNPEYGKGKSNNDYGLGFYCTQNIELAKEWACLKEKNGFVNLYTMETNGLRVLNLLSDEYNILHWLNLLIENRIFRFSTPTMKKGAEWLKSNFHLDLSEYDIIVGYRADDSYFAFAKSFLNNEISLNQLYYAMKLGRFGEQIVMKSQKSFEALTYLSSEEVNCEIYYQKRKSRDDAAREAYRKEIETDDINGLFMRDIIREEVKADDPRLR